jgi:hypothetical protein
MENSVIGNANRDSGLSQISSILKMLRVDKPKKYKILSSSRLITFKMLAPSDFNTA